MTKSREEKIAAALGLKLGNYTAMHPCHQRERIRQRVRELFRDYPGEYGSRDIVITINVDSLETAIELNERDHNGEIQAHDYFDVVAESNAWEKILIWLAEKGEKGNG